MSFWLRPFLLIAGLLAGGLVLQSCQSPQRDTAPEEPDLQTRVPEDPSRESPAGIVPTPRIIDSTFTIRRATPGDQACILRLEREDGSISARPAALEVCLADMDPAELVGRRVRLRVEEAPMLAPECAGDPTCQHVVIADLIVGLEPVPEILRE